jgi:serine/threonine-protein kinase
MELLNGHDLQAEIETRARIPVDEAVEWVLQAMLGVAHAHAKHIVHRDLKPRNLFLAKRDDGTTIVKVLDFGIAKSDDAAGLTQSGAALGTPRYMAPEQLRSARSVDARADIWAFGVVLYELVTGKGIFDTESGLELAAQIVADPHVPLRTRAPELTRELEVVIDRCLAKDPSDRDPDLAALARALAPFAPDSANLVARIEHTLHDSDSVKKSSTGRLGGARRASPDATTRTAPDTPGGAPRSQRRTLAMGLAGIAIVAGAIAAVALARDPKPRSTANAGSSMIVDAAVATIPVDAAGASTLDAAVVSTLDAVEPVAVADAAAPIAATTPPRSRSATRRSPARPPDAEIDAIQKYCRQMGSRAPYFLTVDTGPADFVCGRISLFGCEGVKNRCASVPIGDDEKQRCRDFLGRLVEAGVCK